MTDRYENIRKALAMGPRPGPWVQDGDGVSAADEDVAVAMCCPSDAEAAFIAACDPDTIRTLLKERDELQQSFDLRWRASMRAIKRWQEAHPGSDLTWPDHADLVVWLLEQLDAASGVIPGGDDPVDAALAEKDRRIAELEDSIKAMALRIAEDAARYRLLRKGSVEDVMVVRGLGRWTTE